jgi:hypothetical protein
VKPTNKNHKGYTANWSIKKNPRCHKCDVKLINDRQSPEFNWLPSREARREYVCQSCERKRLDEITLKRKLEKVALENRKRYDEFGDEGEVYIVTNPAWSNWVKIGMAVNSSNRLNGYQTSSPKRDYNLEYFKKFKNRKIAEKIAHDKCGEICSKREGEWFKLPVKKAIHIIKNITEEYYEKETA